MLFKCTCGDNKDDCVECMKNFIKDAEDLHTEVKLLCNLICNSTPNTTIKGEIESKSLSVAHHKFILQA